MPAAAYHTPVMLEESMRMLDVQPSGIYVDATFGGGGHSRAILSRLGEDGRLIAFDRDPDAAANIPGDRRLTVVRNNFRFIHNYVRYLGYRQIDGVLADLGVSSHQFDTPERGFSFRFDSPLDMRMNCQTGISAADVVNNYGEEELASIFRLYGEVDGSRKAAALVCAARAVEPIATTSALNRALESMLPPAAPHKFLARIYQALRIEVNGEMDSLRHLLEGTLKSLRPGGTAVFITYHSLEDRMVKNFLKTGDIGGNDSMDLYGRRQRPFDIITKKPVLPGENEVMSNTRARSAKLRAARRTQE
ncbi:MAG TPA: 16S rRNA (cytosine(1402)-N(4))-methyltransferase RsmH [Candidatus Coprenecus pullistercoris]|nr:16S rRNA (cytosine(1402)-N(4))-methyltransferase RsmH [Candidatus Coprenecus pullistercoris]